MADTSKGQPNGLATLDGDGQLAAGQFPQAAAVTDLTAASGTADGTVADVGASFSQATLNNNFQDLATKVNQILAALRTAGLMDT